MKRNKSLLDQSKVDWLLYNDLDIMQAYPEKLIAADNKAEKKLKERLEEYLIEGEFVEDTPVTGYAVTNFGRCISGKRTPLLKVWRSGRDITLIIGSKRFLYSELLPNFDVEQTTNKLKELNYPMDMFNVYKYE